MNSRILELIKEPELINAEDLKILSEEIGSKPYMQSLRALQLFGVNRFDAENYQKTLSETAAYTTDKKILYQLINGKTPVAEHFTNIEKVTGSEVAEKVSQNIDEEIVSEETSNEIKDLPVEDFAEETVEIDHDKVNDAEELTAVQHPADVTGQEIVVENEPVNDSTDEIKPVVEENVTLDSVQDDFVQAEEEVIIETIIEDKNGKDAEEVADSSQLSFHGTQDFMPEISIKSTADTTAFKAPEKPAVNRHEEEMRNLIEEVERKMKAKKASKAEKSVETDEQTTSGSEISFAETMDFNISSEKSADIVTQSSEREDLKTPKDSQSIPESSTSSNTAQVEGNSTWKPMTAVPTGSSFRGKKAEIQVSETVEKTVSEEIQDSQSEENPVMKPSLSEDSVPPMEEKAESLEPEKQAEPADSNIPKFISTWQSWLKIDRSSPQVEKATAPDNQDTELDAEETNTQEAVSEEIPKQEIKATAIEKFIENEPKISQLKEESSYVVKERKDDISHLMTETLANIYAEQRLYTKAIKGYEILIQRNPDKKDYFNQKIKEIKELRTNNNQQQ